MNFSNSLNYIKKYLKKGNKNSIKLLILTLISIFLSFFLDLTIFKKIYGFISFDRFILVFMLVFFLGMHFVIKIKSMYEFIYKKRYIIAVCILIFIIIMGYSGSSITLLDGVIQPNNTKNEYKTILGKAREIRGDEWTTNTLLAFSQNKTEKKLSYFTMNVRGTKTDMFTVVNAPVLDIVSIGKPFNIGYIFGNRIGLSFQWYARLLALLLSSFELLMIISRKNKLASLVGTLLITFSPAVQWWYSNFIVDILIIGNFSIVAIDKFMLEKRKSIKYLYILALIVLAVSYVFIFYPAWQISFAYVYLALLIFIVIKNRKIYKFNLYDLFAIIIGIAAVCGILLRYYNMSKDTLNILMNTDYPGARFELGGGGAKILFSYIYSMYFPFFDTANPCEYSSMLSFFPMAMILSCIYILRNKGRKEHFKFLIPVWTVTIILSIFSLTTTSSVFSKITLLYMCPPFRVIVPLGFSQILLLIYVIGNIKSEDRILNNKTSAICSFFCTTILICIAIKTAPVGYFGSLKSYISGIYFVILFFTFFTINNIKCKNLAYIMLIGLSIVSGCFVNPIIKGIDVVYDKPLSKEINKIVSEEKDAIWIVDNAFIVPNYLAANGARTINTTNYYPNFNFFNIILGEQEASHNNVKKIYNRYGHVFINITTDDTNVSLIQMDTYKINLNVYKLKELNVKYVCTVRSLDNLSDETVKFQKIYFEDGMYIYKVIY